MRAAAKVCIKKSSEWRDCKTFLNAILETHARAHTHVRTSISWQKQLFPEGAREEGEGEDERGTRTRCCIDRRIYSTGNISGRNTRDRTEKAEKHSRGHLNGGGKGRGLLTHDVCGGPLAPSFRFLFPSSFSSVLPYSRCALLAVPASRRERFRATSPSLRLPLSLTHTYERIHSRHSWKLSSKLPPVE